MSVLDGPGEETSVFAQKVVAERDELRSIVRALEQARDDNAKAVYEWREKAWAMSALAVEWREKVEKALGATVLVDDSHTPDWAASQIGVLVDRTMAVEEAKLMNAAMQNATNVAMSAELDSLRSRVAHIRTVHSGLRWLNAIETALGLEHDPVNHTSEWAHDLIREIREIGNRNPACTHDGDNLEVEGASVDPDGTANQNIGLVIRCTRCKATWARDVIVGRLQPRPGDVRELEEAESAERTARSIQAKLEAETTELRAQLKKANARLTADQWARDVARRTKLPEERPAITKKFHVGPSTSGYITAGLYPDTEQPGEVFIVMDKAGSTINGLCDTIAVLTSIALQHGVPLKLLVEKLGRTRFEPDGQTGDPEIPMAHSIVDYVFRWLGHRFLPKEEETAK